MTLNSSSKNKEKIDAKEIRKRVEEMVSLSVVLDAHLNLIGNMVGAK
jgi:hypothetical protein